MATIRLSAARSVVNAAAIPEQEKAGLLAELNNVSTPLPDTWVYRIVVIALGLAIFVPVFVLLERGPTTTVTQDTIKLLLPIATGALGALVGLLAPSPGAGG